jgi:AmmeMemoRadiSam system protein B
MFYPERPEALRLAVRRFLDEAETGARPSPKAIIAPHAGFIYSGPVAGSAYACVNPENISRVVLVGPSHRVYLSGMAAPEARVWETPLGPVRIDFQSLENVTALPQVLFSDMAHAEEHCLEVQLPFLQVLLGSDFVLAPLVAGDVTPEGAADVLEALWGGPETLVVISSDLSHYLPYAEACAKDRATAEAIEALDVRGLDSDCACGLNMIAGLVCVAQRRGMRAELLDLRNSGDTAGPKDRVVGYSAFAFYEQ